MANIKTALERFEIVEIDRSEIKNAEYNPRVISAEAKRKLKRGIEKLGMLGPIVWNKLTGNIVGGHQRVSIMDALEGSKHYRLTVSAVSLTEKQEREANILLNNTSAMGDFEIGKLQDLLKFDGLDVEAAGWDRADMFKMFGNDQIAEMPEDEAQAVADATRRAREEFDAIREAARKKDGSDFYMVVVFRSPEERLIFCSQYGLDDSRYQSAETIEGLISADSSTVSQVSSSVSLEPNSRS